MRSVNGRPLIESTDSPLVIDAALHHSVRFWHAQMPPEEAAAWQKTAADAWGALQDGFGIVYDTALRPDGNALLYMHPEELELALVAYGCELLDSPTDATDDEIIAINGLLRQIDTIRPAR